jgi:hypothetical protein
MTPNPRQLELAPAVRWKLAALRRRIRRYVWLEGLTTAIACGGVAFWVSLAIDRLFEPLRPVRAVILGLVGLWLAWVLFRRILRRAFVPLENRNMAMLLERYFPQFNESLLTAVELTDRSRELGPYTSQMLAQTCRQAAEPIGEVRLRSVFNPLPLRRSTLTALALAASVWAFGALAPQALTIWARRSLLLADQPWPRNTRLLVEGFENGAAKVARGDDLEVIAKADLNMPLVPKLVEVRYQTESGARLRASMSREGTADPTADRFQQYAYTFRGVLAPIRFDVVGGDDAVEDLRIEVVDSPTLVDMSLQCTFPDYMDRPTRTLPVAGVMQLPVGTRITVRATANKDLVRVEVDDGKEVAEIREGTALESGASRISAVNGPGGGQDSRGIGDSGREGELERAAGFRSFRHLPPELTEDTTLLFTLFDTDGITSRRPVRLALATVADQAPQLSVELGGIGSAITPQARLPAVGRISDDYGIADVWFDYTIDQLEPAARPVESLSGNLTDFPLDHALEVGDLQLTAGQKLLVCVKAADRYDLAEGPNVGTSQRRLLDVVTPQQLRTMLEARELGLRQRFERIVQEVTETRDLLARIDFDLPAADDKENQPAKQSDEDKQSGGEGAEAVEDADAKKEFSPERALALRTLRVQRALQNSRKNAHETLGVAEAFEGIREELINNGIDTAELKTRLQQGIADPLRGIVEAMFPELDRRLERLEATLSQNDAGPKNRELAVAQVDTILESMREVLERMLQLEDFNKAIEQLRQIIRAQERLGEQTRKRHKQRLRELLED